MLVGVSRPALPLLVLLASCRAPADPVPETTAVVTPDHDAPPELGPDPLVEEEPAPMPPPTHVLSIREPVPLEGQTTLEIESVVIESIEASPADPEAHPAGSGIEVSVLLRRGTYEQRTSLTQLSPGYRSRPVGWLEDYRISLLDVADPHRAPRISVVIERVGEARTDAPPVRLRVDKGQPQPLPDGTLLTLLGHGHKRTMTGQSSPLLVALEWSSPGEEPEAQDLSLGPGDDVMRWTWRDLEIEVSAYDYDAWMDLSISRRVLERIQAPTAP